MPTPWNKGLTKDDPRVLSYTLKRNEWLKKNHPFKGKKRPEHSRFMSGENHPFYGKKHLKESKKKISETLSLVNIGENNPNWKGGTTKKYYLFGSGRKNKWNTWRKEVFKRDNWTCKRCGDYQTKLEPHHIFGITDLIKNNLKKHIFNVDNGVTLCYSCHRLVTALNKKG